MGYPGRIQYGQYTYSTTHGSASGGHMFFAFVAQGGVLRFSNSKTQLFTDHGRASDRSCPSACAALWWPWVHAP